VTGLEQINEKSLQFTFIFIIKLELTFTQIHSMSENKRTNYFVIRFKKKQNFRYLPYYLNHSFVHQLNQTCQNRVPEFVAKFRSLPREQFLDWLVEVQHYFSEVFGGSCDESHELGKVFSLFLRQRLWVLKVGVEFGHEVFIDYFELTLLEAWVLVDLF